jgi:hypothetical protein
MTLVVGVNLGYYAMLAADSRITWFDPGKPVSVDDNAEKVFKTSIGLASGSGLIRPVFGLIDALKDRSQILSDPAEMTQFMQGFWGPHGFWSTAKVDDERVGSWARRIGWIFTSVERGEVHLRYYHSERRFEPIDVPRRFPATLLPVDVTAKESESHELRLKANLRKALKAESVDRTLDQNLAAFARFFKKMSTISKVLGPGIQVGYQTGDGEVELTDVMPLSELPD